jgi:hypothetical protein
LVLLLREKQEKSTFEPKTLDSKYILVNIRLHLISTESYHLLIFKVKAAEFVLSVHPDPGFTPQHQFPPPYYLYYQKQNTHFKKKA